MLYLTRKPGEKIVIQGNIIITVINRKEGRVKLGIECTQGTTVYREEIHKKRVAAGICDLPKSGTQHFNEEHGNAETNEHEQSI